MMSRSSNQKGNETRWAELMMSEAMDMEEAVNFLKEEFPIRTLAEVLCEAVGYYLYNKRIEVTPDDARHVLLEKLEEDEDTRKKSKINSWLPLSLVDNDKKQVKSISKESAMQIAFSLKMTLEDAESFLRRCWLDSLYLRDIQDVIYRCGLKCGFNYKEVIDLINEFSYLDLPNADPEIDEDSSNDSLTKVISEKLEKGTIITTNDLRVFIKENEKLFGSYRRRTYDKFIRLYNEIEEYINEASSTAEDTDRVAQKNHNELIQEIIEKPVYGVRELISQKDMLANISLGINELKKTWKDNPVKGLNNIIRNLIAERIPALSSFSSIIKKAPDKTGKPIEIDRKLFMLTWLLCEDGNLEGFLGTSNTKPDTALKNHLETLNDTILLEYGFPPLDARHPFDWAVMNTLYYAHILCKNEDYTEVVCRLEDLFRRL
ncbi:MAG: hypothetical protein FWD05_09180 [Oscillospiraceae bacterium]|nr:hypothetical protein [Oscillospiraceae bacterium]